MKRFHVHVTVGDLEPNIRFYSSVFGSQPTVRKGDYAKWMLEDPRVNFAISTRGATPGIDHLGFQVDSEDELHALQEQVSQAELSVRDQGETTCCYARSEKYWVTDPQGIAWETFRTLGEAAIYGTGGNAAEAGGACCAPEAQPVAFVRQRVDAQVKRDT